MISELQEEKLSTSVQTKIDCNSGGEIVVDEDGDTSC
jgi:hypothetical protein